MGNFTFWNELFLNFLEESDYMYLNVQISSWAGSGSKSSSHFQKVKSPNV